MPKRDASSKSPEITVSNKTVLDRLKPGLALIDTLLPPPPPTGRYVLARAGGAIDRATDAFDREFRMLLEAHAKRDEKGNPIKVDLGNGKTKYEMEDTAAFLAAHEALLDKEVTLAGVRAVTHEELGECPIPMVAERLLLGILIEDAAPK